MDELKIKYSEQFINQYLSDNNIKKVMLFSGGKDSIVVKHLLEKFNVKNIDYYYNNTGIETDSLKTFLLEKYPDVKWITPNLDLIEEWKKRKFMPYAYPRGEDANRLCLIKKINCEYCCYKIKFPQKNRIIDKYSIVINGCKQVDTSNNDIYNNELIYLYNRTYCLPIFNWTDDNVIEYIKENNLELNNDYATINRTYECTWCPTFPIALLDKLQKQYPNFYIKLKDASDYCYENNKYLQESFSDKEEYWECCLNMEKSRKKLYRDNKVFIDPETGIRYDTKTGSIINK